MQTASRRAPRWQRASSLAGEREPAICAGSRNAGRHPAQARLTLMPANPGSQGKAATQRRRWGPPASDGAGRAAPGAPSCGPPGAAPAVPLSPPPAAPAAPVTAASLGPQQPPTRRARSTAPPPRLARGLVCGGARAGARQEDGHGARQEPPHGRRALHVQAQDDVRAARQRVGHLRAPARASAGSHQGPARRRGRAAAGLCLKQSAAVRRAPATAGCPCSPHTLQRAPAARPPRSTPQTAARSRTGSPRRAARPGASACARARGSGGGGGCRGFYGL